ncbi:MAG: DUF1772 domain-containing protein [Burkholderiaceae bacterium]|nr:DUF1772 domain-containing protein [Burkholderiaceae bacterium]
MNRSILGFANLLVAALVIGTAFGIWLGYDPSGLSAAAWVEQQQHAIAALNTSLPALGAVTIALTLASAVVARGDRRAFALLLCACACFVAVALVTRFENQPINALVLGWSPSSPPPDWAVLRDRWWRWHELRAVLGVAGLSLLIAGQLALARRG